MIRIFMIGYSEKKGGVETYISNLCSNLNNNVFEVIYSMPEMTIDGKMWCRPKNRHNYFEYRRFWKAFYKENKFDVVYLNTCDVVSIDDLVFAKKAGVPVRIIHSHSSKNQRTINKKLVWLHNVLEKYNRKNLEKYATHLFACSELAGKWLFEEKKFKIIKNGIRLSDYYYNEGKRAKVRYDNGYGNEKLVGIVGRISEVKNPLFAVKVLEKLFTYEQNVKAVFLGDGELKNETEKTVRELGLENRIQFMGAVENINEWMSGLDCLIMPSLYEGLPFTLVEAQAASLPCVVSSNVSDEANLSDGICFVDLNESLETWCKVILGFLNTDRVNKTEKLVEQGYSIEETANEVTRIIKAACLK